MKTLGVSALGLALFVPMASVRAVALTMIGSEGALTWSRLDDFEGLSYYGSTGVPGVSYQTTPLSVLGGLGTLSLSSGQAVVYGNGPAGASSGAGVPASSFDYPGFSLNGGYAGTALASGKALGIDSASSTVKIQFSQAVDAFGFYGAADLSSAFSVSLFDTSGGLIDVAVDLFGQPQDLDFWGLSSSIGIGSVEITGGHMALDRLLVKGTGLPAITPPTPPAVPEVTVVAPGVVALLAGVELIRRRRR
jgi:hypothetical protein